MKLDQDEKDELVRMIRAVTQKVEDIYRPARAFMNPADTDTDPVLLALCACRDNLMGAENALLRLDLRLPEEETASAD